MQTIFSPWRQALRRDGGWVFQFREFVACMKALEDRCKGFLAGAQSLNIVSINEQKNCEGAWKQTCNLPHQRAAFPSAKFWFRLEDFDIASQPALWAAKIWEWWQPEQAAGMFCYLSISFKGDSGRFTCQKLPGLILGTSWYGWKSHRQRPLESHCQPV